MASRRIFYLADLCPHTGSLVDIGSDHGKLIKLLIQRNFPFPLFASELSSSSFLHLKNQLADYPCHVYQADGLSNLPKEVKHVVIAGMGGQLITQILSQGLNDLSSIDYLILGPQRDVEQIRRWLMTHNWTIEAESFLYEDDHDYPFILAKPGTMDLSPFELAYGPKLIQQKDAEFIKWLQHEKEHLKKQLSLHDDETTLQRWKWIETYVKNL